MGNPTIRQLEYLVAAADTGTVTEAAKRCLASQAAVSSALGDLERTLGLQLLIRRSAKGVAPTPSGERMIAIARRILGDVDELVASADVEVGQVTGKLRVACTIALSPRILPTLAAQFLQAHPRVELDFVDGLATEVQQLVRSADADACLLYGRQAEPDLRVTRLRPVAPFAVLAADHPLARNDRVWLRELAGQRLILVQRAGSLGVIEAVIREAGVEPGQTWSFNNPETVRSMVANGMGYSVFSGKPIGTETWDGRHVAYVPIADQVVPNDVVLGIAADRRPTARIAALEQMLQTPALLAALG